MEKVVLICGKAESGKKEFASLLETELQKNKFTSFIFPITYFFKELLKRQYNWNGKKDKKGRDLLQKIGEEWNNKTPGFWATLSCELLSSLVLDYDVFIVTGVRRVEEIKTFKKKFKNVVAVKVVKDDSETTLTDEQQAHETETALADYKFDFVVDNQSPLHLKEQATDFFNKYLWSKE